MSIDTEEYDSNKLREQIYDVLCVPPYEEDREAALAIKVGLLIEFREVPVKDILKDFTVARLRAEAVRDISGTQAINEIMNVIKEEYPERT